MAQPRSRGGASSAPHRHHTDSFDPSVSIISLVETIIEVAYDEKASDVHIDPVRNGLRVRMRIDGVLQEFEELPKSVHENIVARVKVLAGLRSDEHQAAQDGRFRQALKGGRFVDVRVSIMPTYHGENVVLRLLANTEEEYSLDTLGFSEADRRKIERALRHTSGMVLATGPTGSGKTTTLYTLIKMLNSPEVSIVTIEDPIEYSIDHIEQIQVNPRTGLSFANGLRSILRQDPDIIMVGEIRDADTARIAVNTALTGHLLLSTLHTNDAATTLPRLVDMGIDPYLVASTIKLAIGQRLVRTICPNCKTETNVSAAIAESLPEAGFVEGETVYYGAGCAECGESGYRGRASLIEILVADAAVREAIMRKASAAELKRIAIDGGMTTMLEDGFHKVRQGVTTIEEVLRVTHE
ncbi:MAG: GspE/PulE family protein [Bacillota bacterium]